jgi:hypothetical protein
MASASPIAPERARSRPAALRRPVPRGRLGASPSVADRASAVGSWRQASMCATFPSSLAASRCVRAIVTSAGRDRVSPVLIVRVLRGEQALAARSVTAKRERHEGSPSSRLDDRHVRKQKTSEKLVRKKYRAGRSAASRRAILQPMTDVLDDISKNCIRPGCVGFLAGRDDSAVPPLVSLIFSKACDGTLRPETKSLKVSG